MKAPSTSRNFTSLLNLLPNTLTSLKLQTEGILYCRRLTFAPNMESRIWQEKVGFNLHTCLPTQNHSNPLKLSSESWSAFHSSPLGPSSPFTLELGTMWVGGGGEDRMLRDDHVCGYS